MQQAAVLSCTVAQEGLGMPFGMDPVCIPAVRKDFQHSRLVVDIPGEAGMPVLVQHCSASGWAAVDQ